MQKPTFTKNGLYHIYNRGVEKRNVFMDKQDYLRFLHGLFEFNDKNLKPNFGRDFKSSTSMNLVELGSLQQENRQPRKLLVEILIFTLMPNHFHLLLKQKQENGIVKFMHKLGTGYTKYFNQKYKRVGPLFQGRFKAVGLEEHAHFLHLPHYIHTNPIHSLNEPSSTRFIELEKYRWSSFLDYTGVKNFPSVTQRDFLLDFFGGEEKYKKETKEWLKENAKNTEKIREITLE